MIDSRLAMGVGQISPRLQAGAGDLTSSLARFRPEAWGASLLIGEVTPRRIPLTPSRHHRHDGRAVMPSVVAMVAVPAVADVGVIVVGVKQVMDAVVVAVVAVAVVAHRATRRRCRRWGPRWRR